MRFRNPLDHVQVAAPCKADWDQMIGSDRTRFCGQCNLNVFNLSGMSRSDAETLIAGTEGRLCVRFYRRADGSIITRDCPIGLRAIRDRVSYWTKALTAAALTFLATVGFYRVVPDTGLFNPHLVMGDMRSPVEQVELIQGGMTEPPRTDRVEVGELILKRPPQRRKR